MDDDDEDEEAIEDDMLYRDEFAEIFAVEWPKAKGIIMR